jgi:DNA helicase II / ATP-dependent DNA helicase PcrA
VSAPTLTGESLRAVEHRGSHMQIIASAGSGKTEVVSQRVASLLDDGVRPESIVAFTFTERAAAELKSRIAARAEERMGRAAIDQLSGLFVGTIHAYCFRLLQTAVPRYETYDVLDPNQLTAFLVRESNQLEIRRLDDDNKMFSSIERFLRGLDVVENEMLDPAKLDGDFGDVLSRYVETLERYRLLTFGQQVVRAVHELARPEVAEKIHSTLRHLIVDEYQDVNPAQEALIERLVAGGADLCVVGDDDQAIYQWRGSDVGNIVSFAKRYPNVEQFTIVTNRRSRPTIIETANSFASTVPGRLDKEMLPDRDASPVPEVVAWSAHSEQQEAGYITHLIDALHDESFAYRDIAVLVRGKVAYRQLLDQFAAFDVPVQPGGRSGLFDQPEAEVLGRTFAWLGSIEWGRGYGRRTREDLGPILDTYAHIFNLDGARRRRLRALLQEWKKDVPQEKRPVDLIRSYYVLLDELDVKAWDLSDPTNVNRLGTLARFSMLLADYETVRRRARPDADNPSEQVGGNDRGLWYYKNLGIHIVNYAANAYGDFDGEADVGLDAVDLLTVHSAKGLEWPAVFVPSLTSRRFPSSKTGQQQNWPLPRTLFDADRYEGSDADERRLFYVAMTRARDWLSLSRHDFVGDASGKRPSRSGASPYFTETSTHLVNVDDVVVPTMDDEPDDPNQELALSYSELHQFLDCAMQYRLRTLLGFQPRLAPELGYGKAVHHMLRRLAEVTKERGAVPNGAQISTMLNRDFFLPIANKPAHRNLKEAAQRLLTTYAREHQEDLFRVWEVERPFELRLDGITVVGRADVILDKEGGVPTSLAILDYKTSTSPDVEHDLQLQVYADAGRREGLDVSAAYVHDLKADDRAVVEVSNQAILDAEATITAAAVRLRAKTFEPNPGAGCTTCEVRAMCRSAR